MKIISMVPSWTETLIECGVEVVGRTRFCIHPSERVGDIEVVGGTKDINWEKVSGLEADLLLLDQEENPKSMADSSVLPYFSTHIRSVGDVSRNLRDLNLVLKNYKLEEMAARWDGLVSAGSLKRASCAANGRQGGSPEIKGVTIFQNLPGLIQWIREPTEPIQEIVYVIWRDPWMAVTRDTFIGSVFDLLGYGKLFYAGSTGGSGGTGGLGRLKNKISKPYPEIDLAQFDPNSTLLVFSSEPFPFGKKLNELAELPFASALVDGESFSWFGIRTLRFLETWAK